MTTAARILMAAALGAVALALLAVLLPVRAVCSWYAVRPGRCDAD